MTDIDGPTDPTSGPRSTVDFSGIAWKSVEWTNLCMLYLRACESRLPQSILGDHVAAHDVERIEYDFTRMHRVLRPDTNQFLVALRGAQFDALISEYLSRHRDAVVLHLGCGLHSRALRMAVPDGGPWFDVDLPNVIALRRQLHSESGQYRMIGSSVTDSEWIDELPVGGPVLIVAEGLLMYVTSGEVTELLHRLIDRYDAGELLADFLSPWGPRLSRILTAGIIKWGSPDGVELTQGEPRLRLVESSSIIAGYDRIPLPRQRLLYRIQYAIPAIRNYDRLYRYAF